MPIGIRIFGVILVILIAGCSHENNAEFKFGHLEQIIRILSDEYFEELPMANLVELACFGIASPDRCSDVRTIQGLESVFEERLKDGVSSDSLVDSSVSWVIKDLDRHTTFSTGANRVGSLFSGMFFRRVDSGILIWNVQPGSLGSKLGLKPGDIITSIDGQDLGNQSVNPVLGERVRLEVDRPVIGHVNIEGPLEYNAPIVLEARGFPPGIAYLRVSRFPDSKEVLPSGEVFVTELNNALTNLRLQGPTAWILDLRGNPGGSITSGTYLSGAFGAGILAEAIDRQGISHPFHAFNPSIIGNATVVVLVDRYTASTAEVVAGALAQTSHRVTLIGEQTSGSAMESKVFRIGHGLLQVSTARILVGPSRIEINNQGVPVDSSFSFDPNDLAQGIDAGIVAAIEAITGR